VVGHAPKDVPLRRRIRTMDCMDCHDRPTHIFRSPSQAVNLALETGKIDATLPFVKRTAVQLLVAPYASTPVALHAIADRMTTFFRDKYPQVLQANAAAVSGAIAAVFLCRPASASGLSFGAEEAATLPILALFAVPGVQRIAP